jgi:protein AATF/BFR2
MDVGRLLNTRPTPKASKHENYSSENDQDGAMDFGKKRSVDFDPEDTYTGGDKTAASVERSSKKPKNREHYGELLQNNPAAKRSVKFEDLAPQYSGVVTSRANLGLDYSPESGHQASGSPEDSGSDDRLHTSAALNTNDDSDASDSWDESLNDNPASAKRADVQRGPLKRLQKKLVEFKEDTESHIEIIQKKKIEDHERGKAVLEQFRAWQDVLDMRIALQPLLSAVRDNKVPRDPEAEQLALDLLLDISDVFSESAKCSPEDANSLSKIGKFVEDNVWRPSLDTWHRKATLLAPGDGSASKKTNLKVINQGPFAQVEIAMRDMERLVTRTCIKRGLLSSPKLPDGNSVFFDDGDFYHLLLRESIGKGIGNAHDVLIAAKNMAKPSVKGGTTLSERKPSKGKAMRFEVHEKLVGFMAPLGESAFLWPADRINVFFASVFS